MEPCKEGLPSEKESLKNSVSVKEVLELLDDSLVGAVVPEKLKELHEKLAALSKERQSNQIPLQEIVEVADYLHKTRQDLAAMRPNEIKNDFIPTATDELAAITEATEQATDKILSAMEQIEKLSQVLNDEQAQKVSDIVTDVYEACSFQDITGQRISRAVNALQHVELRVNKLLNYFGNDALDREDRAEKATTPKRANGVERPDEDLLNGPQLPGKGISQDDVDALFD